MKLFGLIACLTLLITPALSTKPQTCLVVSTSAQTVVLQCARQGNLRTNDRVRLHAVPQQEGQ